MRFVKIDQTEFRAALRYGSSRVGVDSYGLLQMGFYPGDNADPTESQRAQLRLYVDGALVDIIEQERPIDSKFKTDANLARLYFMLQSHEEDDLDDLLEEYPGAKACDIKIELYQGCRE